MERPSVEREKILGKIRKASNEAYVTEWDAQGRVGRQKKKSHIRKGKKNKASGGQFEQRVRKDLEEKGWVVDKWSNTIDLSSGSVVSAKRIFNPFSKVMAIGTGFPDFVCFQHMENGRYQVIGVEVKINGTLSREEKLKCKRYLEKKIFSQILIAKKIKEKNRIRIVYQDFMEILARMR